jgi:molybdate transport system substrate-binding protein
MKHLMALSLAALLLGHWHNASAESRDIAVIAPGGIRVALEQLIPGFEAKSGDKVTVKFGSGVATKKQVADGDAFDLTILQPPYPEVIASGNVIADSARQLATISLAVAVKKGAAKPNISTPDAVKRLLLGVSSVSSPDPTATAAGANFAEALKKLGIAEQMQPKLKVAPSGAAAMEALAKGEGEIGITFLSEMDNPGVDAVGPLPRKILPPVSLVGMVSTHAKEPEAAKKLLDYLSSHEAAAVYKSKGMKPGR